MADTNAWAKNVSLLYQPQKEAVQRYMPKENIIGYAWFIITHGRIKIVLGQLGT